MAELWTLLADAAWIWLALGLALLLLELATGTLFLLGPGVAALLTAAVAYVAPDASATLLLTVFAALSVALTVVGRSDRVRRAVQRASDRPLLNRKSDQLVGRRVSALAAFSAGEGPVSLNDTRYLARLAPGEAETVTPGETLEIRAVDSATLIVARPRG